MNIYSYVKKAKEKYQKGNNIIEYLEGLSVKPNNRTDIINISYDIQAGTYTKFAKTNKSFVDLYTSEIAKIFNKFSFKNILEVGVGEATTLNNVLNKLNKKNI